jgi:hypothetical protein
MVCYLFADVKSSSSFVCEVNLISIAESHRKGCAHTTKTTTLCGKYTKGMPGAMQTVSEPPHAHMLHWYTASKSTSRARFTGTLKRKLLRAT